MFFLGGIEMRLVKWEPLHEVTSLQNQIDRLFNDFWKENKTLNLYPPVEVVETKEEYLVKADLPGVNKENIDISLNNNILTIKAERKEVKDENTGTYHHKEISYGSFQKQVSFSSNTDAENIKAKYADGVLELVVPKLDKDKTKKIVIE